MVESPFPKEVICEVCGKKCRSHSRTRYICKGCFQGEPAAACKRCGQKRHNVSPESGLCPRCAALEQSALLQGIICEICGKRCSQSCLKKRNICQKCFLNEPKAACKRCGQTRHRISPETDLCPRCAAFEQSALPQGIVCEIC